MRGGPDQRKVLIDAGWRRGSLIVYSDHTSSIDLPELIKSNLASSIEDIILICMTYDCAIVDGDFNKEPWLQVLVAWPTLVADKQYEDVRSLRKIQFCISPESGQDITYECTGLSVVNITRQSLLSAEPSNMFAISQQTLSKLIGWYSGRVTKTAFPDAWEKRFVNSSKSLKRKFYKKEWFNNAIPAVYVKLNTWNELDDADVYTANIYIVHNLETGARAFLKAYEDEIISGFSMAFSLAKGINFLGTEIIYENEITLAMLRDYKQIYLDEFSYQVSESSDLPATFN